LEKVCPFRWPHLRLTDSLIGDLISPSDSKAPHRTQLNVRRRFQFSSALKRMSTVSTLPGGKVIVAVKGAPETIKGMLKLVPEGYDDTYKWFTRRGSRVLALGMKEMDALTVDKVRSPLNIQSIRLMLIKVDQQTPPRSSGM
jgi:magnesium-transporting ATPase (P-type)